MKKYSKIKNFNDFLVKICIYHIENYENKFWDKSPKNRSILQKMGLLGFILSLFETFLLKKSKIITTHKN